MSDYMIPAEATFYEQEIKRSRFLTWVIHTKSPAVAKQQIENIRKQYPDARHVCWAWIADAPDEVPSKHVEKLKQQLPFAVKFKSIKASS